MLFENGTGLAMWDDAIEPVAAIGSFQNRSRLLRTGFYPLPRSTPFPGSGVCFSQLLMIG